MNIKYYKMPAVAIHSFYRFFDFHDFKDWRKPLIEVCEEARLRGTIHLASEGINATVSGSPTEVGRLLGFLEKDPRMADLETRKSTHDEQPFRRMKVRLKKEAVTIGLGSGIADPRKHVGRYLEPVEWDRLREDPGATIVDTRNHFEVERGTFPGAVDPHTRSFGEFPAFVQEHLKGKEDEPVGLFCTGGIRCEKATAYLLEHGFKQVYHLRGGILRYLEELPPGVQQFQGKCFVFDERGTVDAELRASPDA
jgi:UPF0176 protein